MLAPFQLLATPRVDFTDIPVFSLNQVREHIFRRFFIHFFHKRRFSPLTLCSFFQNLLTPILSQPVTEPPAPIYLVNPVIIFNLPAQV